MIFKILSKPFCDSMIQCQRRRMVLFYAFKFNIFLQKVTQQELPLCSALPNPSQGDFLTGFSPLVWEFRQSFCIFSSSEMFYTTAVTSHLPKYLSDPNPTKVLKLVGSSNSPKWGWGKFEPWGCSFCARPVTGRAGGCRSARILLNTRLDEVCPVPLRGFMEIQEAKRSQQSTEPLEIKLFHILLQKLVKRERL